MRNEREQPLLDYINRFCQDIRDTYSSPRYQLHTGNIKTGLRNADGTGVLAGVTGIGSVQGYMMLDGEAIPMPGRLYYRGIDIRQIVDAHIEEDIFGFEEVSYLLLRGKLPTQTQLKVFSDILSIARRLPEGFTEDIILKAPSSNIINKLARGVLTLYSYDDEPDDLSIDNLLRQSINLIARVPVLVAYDFAAKRHFYDGEELILREPLENVSLAENFLHMIERDHKYTREEARLLDLIFTIYAEHGGGNNSAFVCRALSSTGTDTYSAVASAICAVKGHRDGGTNVRVMEMLENIRRNVPDISDEERLADYLRAIRDGEAGDGSGNIYGLGHAVYTQSDPRTLLLKQAAVKLAAKTGYDKDFSDMEAIERVGLRVLNENRAVPRSLCANVDMYSGLVFRMLQLPEELYAPLFCIARISAFCAHRIEEIICSHRIMRPAYRSIAVRTDYVPMAERGE